MKYSIEKFGVVLLAAGGSTRLGSPKPLLHFQEKTFIQSKVDLLEHIGFKHVAIVLGAEAALIESSTKFPASFNIVYNPHWQNGMSSSIQKGISSLLGLFPLLEGVIFMVCDQPFLNDAILNLIIQKSMQNPGKVVACKYAIGQGTPLFLPKNYFWLVENVKEDCGLKSILTSTNIQPELVNFERGNIDIDTPNAYEMLRNGLL